MQLAAATPQGLKSLGLGFQRAGQALRKHKTDVAANFQQSVLYSAHGTSTS